MKSQGDWVSPTTRAVDRAPDEFAGTARGRSERCRRAPALRAKAAATRGAVAAGRVDTTSCSTCGYQAVSQVNSSTLSRALDI